MPVAGVTLGETRIREAITVMANVEDVAAFILGERGEMSAMKLQKLCYYAYGYHLAWEGRQLFPERFEAWANGPVCPVLYQKHRGRFMLRPGEIRGNPDALDDGEHESVRLVLDGYGDLSAHQLSVATHREEPWLAARERAGAAPLERSTEELLDTEIAEFFEALTAAE
jgi:uncharacterized phage-associated protein